MDKYLVVLAGPTAVGKTETAIKLAQAFDTEIISADSRQIYKEMKIGTAQPTEEELKAAKHHFIAVKSVFEYYNASKYEFEVLDLLKKLFEKKDIVILTGGSGLYINAVLYGIDEMPTVDISIRNRLMKEYEEKGLQHIQNLLKKLDYEYYKQVDLNNPKRILKALEITIQTGKPYSSFLTHKPKKRFFKTVKIALNRPREELYDRINKRVLKMIDEGLIDEARKLFPYRHLTPLNTVGYKELFDYFESKISLEEAIDLIQRHTRQYARKQISWFRRDTYQWFEPSQIPQILQYINSATVNRKKFSAD